MQCTFNPEILTKNSTARIVELLSLPLCILVGRTRPRSSLLVRCPRHWKTQCNRRFLSHHFSPWSRPPVAQPIHLELHAKNQSPCLFSPLVFRFSFLQSSNAHDGSARCSNRSFYRVRHTQVVKGNSLAPERGWKCVLAFFAFDDDVPGSNRCAAFPPTFRFLATNACQSGGGYHRPAFSPDIRNCSARYFCPLVEMHVLA